MRWIKDQKVEANMKALGISMEVEKINVDDVDWAEGLRRQTRLIGKLNQDYVLQLACAMGPPEAAFPMIVLQKPPHKNIKMWPWSGNHRGASYLLAYPDEKVIDAYTIKLTDLRMMDILPRIVNAWESGLGFSKEEKIANAKWLVEHHSMTTQEAANLLGIRKEWIGVARRQEDVKKIVADVPKANGIAKSILTRMAPIENPNVLRATARILCEHGIKGDDAQHLVADVRTAKTELQQMSELARWEKLAKERTVPRPTGGTPGKKNETKIIFSANTREAFLRHMTGLAKVLAKADTIEKLQCTDPADQDVMLRNWALIERTMRNVVKGGGK